MTVWSTTTTAVPRRELYAGDSDGKKKKKGKKKNRERGREEGRGRNSYPLIERPFLFSQLWWRLDRERGEGGKR